MDSVAMNQEPVFSFEFRCRPHQQKYLIDALLRYNRITLNDLACLLDIPLLSLKAASQGKGYLNHQQAIVLAQYFLISFSD